MCKNKPNFELNISGLTTDSNLDSDMLALATFNWISTVLLFCPKAEGYKYIKSPLTFCDRKCNYFNLW